MKKLILLLSPLLILALVVAGCAPAEQSIPEEAPGALVTTEAPAEAPAASEMVTEEPAAGVAETPAAAEEVEAGAVTTEEPAEAPEASGMATEEPEAGALATEEPEASMAETPATTTDEVAESAQTDETEVIPPTGAVNLGRMSDLLNFEVWNNNNEQIGSVNAVVINPDTSQIEYVIVGIGGFLGLGESELPVPWQVAQLAAAAAVEAEGSAESDETQMTETPQNVFILDLSQEELEQLPAFDLTSLYEQAQVAGEEAQAPEAMSLQELEQQIQSFWQSEPGTEMSEAKNLVLAEDLLGATVRDPAAVGMSEQSSDTTQEDTTQVEPIQDLGLVEEIMVDLNTGKVTYLLVSLNEAPTVGLEDPAAVGVEATPAEGVQEAPAAEVQDPLAIQTVPVPLEALEWNPEEGVLFYSGSQSLEEAPTIDLEQFEIDQSFSWMTEADSFWGMEENPESETE